jgi:drug/metabolite transporter (DMT)-like permease
MKTWTKKTENIHQNLKFFFYTMKVFGLAPFSIDEKTRKLQMKWKNHLILTISLALCAGCLWASLINFTQKSDLLERISQATFLLQHVFALVLIVINCARRKHIENFWSNIHKFDETLDKFKWKFVGDKLQWCNAFFIGFHLAFVFVVVLYSIGAYFFFFEQNFEVLFMVRALIYQLTSFFYLLIAIQFLLSVKCIKSRLEALEKHLK